MAGPEAEVIPLCERNGISQVVWSPLAQGVLTGKYRPGEALPPDSRARSSKMNRFIKQWLTDEILEAVDRLRPVAEGAGLTLSQLALAWILRQDNVAAAIVGATRPEQVRENVAAAGVRLSDDTLRAIDDVLRIPSPSVSGRGRKLRRTTRWMPGRDDARLVGEDHGLHAVAQPELEQDPADVGLDGLLAQHEPLRHLAVVSARGQSSIQDFELPRRQLAEPASGSTRRHARVREVAR